MTIVQVTQAFDRLLSAMEREAAPPAQSALCDMFNRYYHEEERLWSRDPQIAVQAFDHQANVLAGLHLALLKYPETRKAFSALSGQFCEGERRGPAHN